MTTLTAETPVAGTLVAERPMLEVIRAARAGRAGRNVRSDALPEQVEYRDDGCDLFPSCLACPLPRCRYDVPGGVRAMLNQERDHQIRVMREAAGLSVDALADRFDVSRRTVFRALSSIPAGRCAPASRGRTRTRTHTEGGRA
ncbi:MAG: HTH domain-containing protein [Dehalococcoidia bacterium]